MQYNSGWYKEPFLIILLLSILIVLETVDEELWLTMETILRSIVAVTLCMQWLYLMDLQQQELIFPDTSYNNDYNINF